MHKLEKMKKFPVSVPQELHTKFKVLCASTGVPMTEIVRKLLERECAEASKAKKPAKSGQPESATAA